MTDAQDTQDTIDERIKLLSYSSRSQLHACPRAYELYKKRSIGEYNDEDVQQVEEATFSFGHIVGDGVQEVLKGTPLDKVILKAFLAFKGDLDYYDDKRQKSFSLAIVAIQKFKAALDTGLLRGYELAYYNGEPCCELGFTISMPDGFKFRGSIDAVLTNRLTGEIVVLECKTTSLKSVNPAMYKNSSQALGYAVVLDALFPNITSYRVLYLAYLTKTFEYAPPISFNKSLTERATWIRDLIIDMEIIKLYEASGAYPKNGDNCINKYHKTCKFIDVCNLSTKHLTLPINAKEQARLLAEEAKFPIKLDLMDLITAQQSREVDAPAEAKIENYSEALINNTIGDL
jgi:hypothetical protein